MIYFIAGFLLAAAIRLHDLTQPFDSEYITKGVITREVVYQGRRSHRVTYYTYRVNGKEYENGFGKDNKSAKRYITGDTLDITYDLLHPENSVPTYTQYWYINSDKEPYWIKIKQGIGMQKRRHNMWDI